MAEQKGAAPAAEKKKKEGKGVPQADKKKAFECWRKAKDRFDDTASLQIARCLISGLGTEKNLTEAKTILLDLISKKVEGAATLYQENFRD